MKPFFVLLFLFQLLNNVVNAQSDRFQIQINEQVWKPFMRSFNERNTDGFMAVHSKEVTRVIRDENKILGYDQYYYENKLGNENGKKSKWKSTIELRFTQRIAIENRAFESGYYKTTSISAEGKSRTGYGKFIVLLRKENGVWKILMDSDANEKTDESVFLSGNPME